MRPTSRLRSAEPPEKGGSLTLRRHPSEAERARRFVAAACEGYDEDAVRTAMLLTSELITNAVRHGTGRITVVVAVGAGELRVDVADESRHTPLPRDADPDDESGRGLRIVEAMATSWGVDPKPRGAGKSVWFVLRAA